jgi:hypothetical protein
VVVVVGGEGSCGELVKASKQANAVPRSCGFSALSSSAYLDSHTLPRHSSQVDSFLVKWALSQLCSFRILTLSSPPPIQASFFSSQRDSAQEKKLRRPNSRNSR